MNATYLINISNLGNNTNPIIYNLSVQGSGLLNASQITLNSTTMGGVISAIVQLNVSNAAAGTYYTNITAVASDNSSAIFVSLGNGLASQITTTVLDITNPQVINTTSASGNPNSTILVNTTATDNVAVAQVFINLSSIGGSALTAMSLVSGNTTNGTYAANITVPLYTLNGIYALPIRANDTSGNVNGTQTITLTVNNVAPVVTVISPVSGYIRGTVIVNATVTDNNGNGTVANVTFYYYNGTYNFIGSQNVSQGNAVYNVSWNTAGLNLANISIFVNATDGTNWANGTSGSTFVVDSIAPQFSAISVNSNSVYAGNFNFSVTITGLYFASASYSIYNATNSSIIWTNNATATTANGTFSSIAFDGIYLPVGNWTINVSATDLAGNLNSTAANITSYAAIRAPSAYDSQAQAPGTIGSGTPGIYNFTIYAKGYQYTRMYLNLTSGSNKFATSNNTNNAYLYNGTGSAAIDDNGAYSNAATLMVSGISAGALPGYATGGITAGIYKQALQIYLYPYSGLSAGTYSGNFGFALSQTP
ncbi:Uncharacterised protein [uncultured archaeon]|nr:Uncharacterised protein [uncultured archaeon]